MSNKKKLIRFVRRSKVAKTTDSEQIYKHEMKRAGQHSCPICGPWEGENTIQRKPKHGSKKPKYKNKRG